MVILFSRHGADAHVSLSILHRAEESEYGPLEYNFEVEGTSGRVVYLARGFTSTEHFILWVWRELLLSAIVHRQGDTTMVKTFVADIKKLKLNKEILKLLDGEALRA